jgi:hypothetical protein
LFSDYAWRKKREKVRMEEEEGKGKDGGKRGRKEGADEN